jgi:hypothetical protein
MRTDPWANRLRWAAALGLGAIGVGLGAYGVFGLVGVEADWFHTVQQFLIGAILTALWALSIVLAAILARRRPRQSRDISER